MVPKSTASKPILNKRMLFYFYWLFIFQLSLFGKNRFMLLLIRLLKCWLYVYILLNICPAFMSICLPFLLYVCGFFSKDHAYTSIEDSMAIGDPRVVVCCNFVWLVLVSHGFALFRMVLHDFAWFEFFADALFLQSRVVL